MSGAPLLTVTADAGAIVAGTDTGTATALVTAVATGTDTVTVVVTAAESSEFTTLGPDSAAAVPAAVGVDTLHRQRQR